MRQILKSQLDSLIKYDFDRGNHRPQITGFHSLMPLAFHLACSIEQHDPHSHLIVVPHEDDARRLISFLNFFNHQLKTELLLAWDTTPFSNLESSKKITFDRCSFLYHANQKFPNRLLIASTTGLMQKTVPRSEFLKSCYKIKVGDTLPEQFLKNLESIGYQESPIVEDKGQFNSRSNIIDIFTPQFENPVRIELFGDTVEKLRFFSTENQLSQADTLPWIDIIPCSELLLSDDNRISIIDNLRKLLSQTGFSQESHEIIKKLSLGHRYAGIEFLLPLQETTQSQTALDHLIGDFIIWNYHTNEQQTASDSLFRELQSDANHIHPLALNQLEPSQFYQDFQSLPFELFDRVIDLNSVTLDDFNTDTTTSSAFDAIVYHNHAIVKWTKSELSGLVGSPEWIKDQTQKIQTYLDQGYQIFIALRNHNLLARWKFIFEKTDLKFATLPEGTSLFTKNTTNSLCLVSGLLTESLRLPSEKLIFLRDEDFFGKKSGRRSPQSDRQEFDQKSALLNFADLKVGDLVVHTQHGIGVFEGLKIMSLGSIESEFVQIKYRDSDKLYLPAFRINQIQKYSGPSASISLDRLGGQTWEKTKVKVGNAVRDIASDLIRLYAERATLNRAPVMFNQQQLELFEQAFPFDETEDQKRAIDAIFKDLSSTKPMDRLICGDVGFGKTEVAMRAAFGVATTKKQVAIICPTTVLCFQHFESFLKRFKSWDLKIERINRFVSNQETKKILLDLQDGKIDILIGTHRLLSKDVQFADLGLLIIDEEQKFGVTHKEKLRKIKTHVDTLTLSATPIPRTLNLSLMGVRDLSLINTPPTDRLATRTFVTKWNDDLIRKAILNEVQRGGQTYFIHNRVQSLYELLNDLRRLLPNHVRLKVAHGQLPEDELEQTMVGFFNHEFDVLVCTAIVESGMDVPKANTIFIDQPQLLGLSQLYQLRGRVGRSKERAYCYLLSPKNRELDPDATERLRVLKENSELGSGIRIAQYDLELRGSGNILGEDQSGHIASVGYELYMDLLDQAVADLKGETKSLQIDPEINLRIAALIPDKYIEDIRVRLAYYKAFSTISGEEDFEKFENELKDRFGDLPEQVTNLLGINLIRSACIRFGITDLSQGLKNITLTFSPNTPVRAELAIAASMRDNKKFQLLPNNRFNIRINDISWSRVYNELLELKQFT